MNVTDAFRPDDPPARDTHKRPHYPWRQTAQPPAAPPDERFSRSPGAVRVLMKDGMWLVPESERPATPRAG